jgi:hypothetical protein
MLQGGGFTNEALMFPEIHVLAKAGKNDVAYLHGTPDGDRFRGTQVYGRLGGLREDGTTFFHRAVRFDSVYAIAHGGVDRADLFDSHLDDIFEATPAESCQYNPRFRQTVMNFVTVVAHANHGQGGGYDTGYLNGYSPSDTLIQDAVKTILCNDQYYIALEAYEDVHAMPANASSVLSGIAKTAAAPTDQGVQDPHLADAVLMSLANDWARHQASASSRGATTKRDDHQDRSSRTIDPWWVDGP